MQTSRSSPICRPAVPHQFAEQISDLTKQLHGLQADSHTAALQHSALLLEHAAAIEHVHLQSALELLQTTASLRECLAAAHEENLAEKMAELQTAHQEELRLKGIFLSGSQNRNLQCLTIKKKKL